MTTASESAVRQIQSNRNLIIKIPQTYMYLFVNPTTVRFQIGFTAKAPQTIMLGHHQLTEKPSHFSSQREESQKAET